MVLFVCVKAGVAVTQDSDFRAVIHTFSPGLVTIKLRVEVLNNDFQQASEHAHLEDELQIQVRFNSSRTKFFISFYQAQCLNTI